MEAKLKLHISAVINNRNEFFTVDSLDLKGVFSPVHTVQENQMFLAHMITEAMVQHKGFRAAIRIAQEMYNDHNAKQS